MQASMGKRPLLRLEGNAQQKKHAKPDNKLMADNHENAQNLARTAPSLEAKSTGNPVQDHASPGIIGGPERSPLKDNSDTLDAATPAL